MTTQHIIKSIEYAISKAKSLTKPSKTGEVAATALSDKVTLSSLFSICLEYSLEYKTYSVKIGARVGKSKKHYKYQIDTKIATTWNEIIHQYTLQDGTISEEFDVTTDTFASSGDQI